MAMLIMWREAMSVDGGVIDSDHKALIAIINEFGDALPDINAREHLCSIILKLNNYANMHFRREETLQIAINYPEHEAHCQEHAKLIDALSRVLEELGATQEQELDVVHKRMVEFLHHWLIDHVIKLDLRMKPFVGQFKTRSRRSG
jgi:hemerythrin-like metal-binding protein